jgi:hypothetical protein
MPQATEDELMALADFFALDAEVNSSVAAALRASTKEQQP